MTEPTIARHEILSYQVEAAVAQWSEELHQQWQDKVDTPEEVKVKAVAKIYRASLDSLSTDLMAQLLATAVYELAELRAMGIGKDVEV